MDDSLKRALDNVNRYVRQVGSTKTEVDKKIAIDNAMDAIAILKSTINIIARNKPKNFSADVLAMAACSVKKEDFTEGEWALMQNPKT